LANELAIGDKNASRSSVLFKKQARDNLFDEKVGTSFN
jgi:hypothetical protein